MIWKNFSRWLTLSILEYSAAYLVMKETFRDCFFLRISKYLSGFLTLATAFRRSYEAPIVNLQLPGCDEDQLEMGNDSAAGLLHLTSQFVLRRTQQVMKDHLPPKVETVIFCRPSAVQVIYISLYSVEKLILNYNSMTCYRGRHPWGGHYFF